MAAATARPVQVKSYIDDIAHRALVQTVLNLFDPVVTDTAVGVRNNLVEELNLSHTSYSHDVLGLNVSLNGVHSDYRVGPIIKLYNHIKQKYLMMYPHQETIFTQDHFTKLLIGQIVHFDDTSSGGRGAIQSISGVKVHININLKPECIVNQVLNIAQYASVSGLSNFKTSTPLTVPVTERIVMDFSSPNVAKELHFGHLRSTIIGDSLYRLMSLFISDPSTQILCLNHIGDWGTQFGMIINYLRSKFSNDFNQIIDSLQTADSSSLLETYRSAKAVFDADPEFANQSRYQTACLQKNTFGDDHAEIRTHVENLKIWKMICETSRSSYSTVYERLGITSSLTERGESFYNPFIPGVVDMLKSADLVYEEDSALKIWFDGWEFPFIVVKSDGGYTYAMTDIAAVWHRIFVESATHIIYITDKGQAPHFEKVFDVAKKMGWLDNGHRSVKLSHIGFGLVSGKDGKKLKTRDGDVIRLMDVIEDVSTISERVIRDRATKAKANDAGAEENFTNSKYATIDDQTISKMSSTIAVNTLKYNDFSYLYGSDYPYDPEKLFEFQGDTGVYQMYCYCRIASVIEKSSYDRADFPRITDELVQSFNRLPVVSENPDFSDMTQIDRDLLFHLIGFDTAFETAYSDLTIKPIVDFCKKLTALFSKYVSKNNIKIIEASTEKFRIAVCCTVITMLDTIFETLGFGKIDFI